MVKKVMLVFAVLLVLCGISYAMQPEVVGGIRKGVALGVYGDQYLESRLYLHTGIEANTSKQPIIGIFGASIFLARLANRYPLLMNLGLVVYGGEKTEAGLNLSFNFERFLDIKNLFLETGIDVVGSGGNLLLQIGYKL